MTAPLGTDLRGVAARARDRTSGAPRVARVYVPRLVLRRHKASGVDVREILLALAHKSGTFDRKEFSKSDTWEINFLRLELANQAAARIGDLGGLQPSATAGSLYNSLHTADPGEGGGQTTNEATYTDYARAGIARALASWTFSGTSPTQAANAILVTFPVAGIGSPQNIITHAGLGTDSAGAAGYLMYSGALTSSLTVNQNVQPEYQIGSLVITED